MSTYEVKDHTQWREGDHALIKFVSGTTIEGDLVHALDDSPALLIRSTLQTARNGRGDLINDGRTITVTRTVEDIPEPTGLGAVVRFESGAQVTRGRGDWHTDRWYMDSVGWLSWEQLAERHGPAVALLSPGVQDGAR